MCLYAANMNDVDRNLLEDKTFKRVVVFSTGLGLASMLASLAAIRIGKVEGLQFTWHWSIILWMVIATVWNWRFWNVVWLTQTEPTPERKRVLKVYCGILFLIGLAAFLYPIRFIERSYWAGVATGLATAFTFLGVMFWIIYKFGQRFFEEDEAALKRTAV
jgi:hypothetical protein